MYAIMYEYKMVSGIPMVPSGGGGGQSCYDVCMYVCIYKYLIILAGTTSCCVFFIQYPYTQPKCHEVVLYTDDMQLLYQIDFFI